MKHKCKYNMKQKDTITTKWENIKKWENLTIQFTFNQCSPPSAAFTYDVKQQEAYYYWCDCVFFRMTISLWISIIWVKLICFLKSVGCTKRELQNVIWGEIDIILSSSSLWNNRTHQTLKPSPTWHQILSMNSSWWTLSIPLATCCWGQLFSKKNC